MSEVKLQIKLNLPYFYGNETEIFQFFKLPKILFSDSRFQDLSNDSKLLYSFFLDRVALSITNDWRDEEGRVYIIYTTEEASHLLGKSTRTVGNLMKELDEVTGCGLIERKKRGLGKPDLIYVKNLAVLVSEMEEIPEAPLILAPTGTETGVLLVGNTAGTVVHIGEKLSTISSKITCEGVALVQEVPVQSGNIVTSREEKTSGLDTKKLPAIKTDITNTDQIQTEVLKPTLPPNPMPTFPQSAPPTKFEWEEEWLGSDKHGRHDLIAYELMRAYHRGKEELSWLMYNLRTDESKLEATIYVLMGMEDFENNPMAQEEYSTTHFHFACRKLYARALLEMLTSEKMTKVKTGYVSYAKVMDKLLEHIVMGEYSTDVLFNGIVDCTVQAYQQANQESEIKFPVPYMKSCIWTTLCEGNIRGEADFQRLYC